MPDIHYPIGGSNAHIWMECPASVWLPRMCKKKPVGPAAERGTRIHALAERIYKGDLDFAKDDFEEVAIAQRYISACKAKFKTMNLETHVIHSTICGGTIDGTYYDAESSTLYLWDLKTGKTLVDPNNNWQLLFYAYILNMVADNYSLGIYQEDMFRWWVIPKNVFDTRCIFIKDAIEKIKAEYVASNVGEHCLWCKGKDACVRYQETKPKAPVVVVTPPEVKPSVF